MAKTTLSEEHIIDSDAELSESELAEQNSALVAKTIEKTLAAPKSYHRHSTKSKEELKPLLKHAQNLVLIRVPKGMDLSQVKKLKSGVKVNGKSFNVNKSESGKPLQLIFNGKIRAELKERIVVTEKVEIPQIDYSKVVVERKDVEVVKLARRH